jgi:hypothetical protein
VLRYSDPNEGLIESKVAPRAKAMGRFQDPGVIPLSVRWGGTDRATGLKAPGDFYPALSGWVLLFVAFLVRVDIK